MTVLPRAGLLAGVATLSPGYFALVMATGIISLGLREVGFDGAARVMLVVALVAYLILAILYAVRWARFRPQVRRDERDPRIAFGYFTVVAGTCVIAVNLLRESLPLAAEALVVLAGAIWLILGYLLPWRVLVVGDGVPVLARVNGTWFVWCVASQSLAVALAATDQVASQGHVGLGFLAVLSWSVGALLYAVIAVLVVLRLVHFGISARDFEPPYWVAMGALAISVVAGAGIVQMSASPIVDAARGLIGGTVVIFWCCAVWLIPPLVGAGVWRHLIHRVPLRYTPGLWSMVFPLGMFAYASIQLGRVEHLPVIETIGSGFLWIAVLAWCAVTAGLVSTLRGASSRWSRASAPSG